MAVALTIAAVIVLLAILLNAVTRSMARQGEQRFPPDGEFIDVGSTRLHFVRRGGGRPVVLLHGSEGFLQDFTDTIFEDLSSAADCIAFDRPGHGYSDIPHQPADMGRRRG